MATKKEFVVQLVEDMKSNARAVLKGHGLRPDILNVICERADIMSKLGSIAWNLKWANSGKNALIHRPNFKIFGYDSFGRFNMEARTDVEEFINGLSEEDQKSFTNNDNIVVIIAQPDSEIIEDDETQIVTGPSLIVPFDKAVRAEQKTIGGKYIAVMFGESAIRSTGTPKTEVSTGVSAQKRKLLAKRRAKKAELNKKVYALRGKASDLQRQIAAGTAQQAIKAGIVQQAAAYGPRLAEALKHLNNRDKKLVNTFMTLKDEDFATAKNVLKNIKNEEVIRLLLDGEPNAETNLTARRTKIRQELAKWRSKAEHALVQIKLARMEGNKKGVITAQANLRRATAKVQELRAALDTYSRMSSKALSKKAEALKKTNDAIEKLIAKGATLDQAIEKSIAKLNATPAEKDLIKEQVMAEVADGTIAQFAVQQAIQDNLDAEDDTNIDDLINAI